MMSNFVSQMVTKYGWICLRLSIISIYSNSSAKAAAYYGSTLNDSHSDVAGASVFAWPPESPIPVHIFRLSSVANFTPGMQVAFERMRMNKTLMAAFDLKITSVSFSTLLSGKNTSVLREMISTIADSNDTYDILLGSDSNVDNIGLAQITPVFNLVQLCIFCRASELSNKDDVYQMLIRDSPRDEDYRIVTGALIDALGVESLVTLAGDDHVIADNIRAIEDSLMEAGKRIQYSGTITFSTIADVMTALKKVMPNYILAMPVSQAMPKLVCESYRQRLVTPDRTIYIVVGPFAVPEFWVPPKYGARAWNCTEVEMAEAIQGSFIIDMTVDQTPDTVRVGGINSQQLEDRLRQHANLTATEHDINSLLFPTSTYHMYDLTWSAIDGLYRTGVRMSLSDSNLSLASGLTAPYRSRERMQFSKLLIDEIGKSRFYGATGEFVYSANKDRYVDLSIVQLQLDYSNSSDVFVVPVPVGLYHAQLGVVTLEENLFRFATPTNQPPGKWLRSKAAEETRDATVRLTIILVVVGAAAIATVTGTAAYCYVNLSKLQLSDYDDDKSDGKQGVAVSRISLNSSNTSASLPSRRNTTDALHTFAATGKVPPNRGRACLVDTTNGGIAEKEVWIRMVQKHALAPGAAQVARFTPSNNSRGNISVSFSRRQKLYLNHWIPQATALRSLHHSNVAQFVGLCLDYGQQQTAFILFEGASNGAIRRYIVNSNFELGTDLKNSVMFDIACGLQFVHDKRNALTFGGAHGFLHSNNVVLDNKFTAKLTDYGFWQCRALRDFVPVDEHLLSQAAPEKLFMWLKRAPEFLRNGMPVLQRPSSAFLDGNDGRWLKGAENAFASACTSHKSGAAELIEQMEALQRGDVHSLGMILVELFTRRLPYLGNYVAPSRTLLEGLICYIASGSGADANLSKREKFLALNNQQPPVLLESFRRESNTDERSSCITEHLKSLMTACTHTNPCMRPTANDAVRRIQKLPNFSTASVVENLVDKLHSYAANLELVVEKRTKALADEMERSDQLLLQILPRSVAEQLKQGHHVPPELFDSVSIYFSDIVSFTELCSESNPTEVVVMLNGLYTMFDSVLENFDAYKVETIGDAYMVASGLPIQNGNKHLSEIAHMSLMLLKAVSKVIIAHRPGESMMLRIGLHTGPCAAGVVGIKMPRYCLFGDTVNTASRMESTGEAGKIHVSEAFCTALENQFANKFRIEERGEVAVKGKGIIKTGWLVE